MAETLDTLSNSEATEILENTRKNENLPDIDSKYRLILLAAQRSKQLQRGAAPRVDADPRKAKPTRIAMEEIKRGKVGFDITTEK